MREKLITSLENSLSNEDATRKAAEKLIKDTEKLPGYLPLLM